jgi:hypothetical protein
MNIKASTWLDSFIVPEQPKKQHRNKHKPGKCGKADCTNPRDITKSGWVKTYCKEHLRERYREYYARRKADLIAAGVESYSVLI